MIDLRGSAFPHGFFTVISSRYSERSVSPLARLRRKMRGSLLVTELCQYTTKGYANGSAQLFLSLIFGFFFVCYRRWMFSWARSASTAWRTGDFWYLRLSSRDLKPAFRLSKRVLARRLTRTAMVVVLFQGGAYTTKST